MPNLQSPFIVSRTQTPLQENVELERVEDISFQENCGGHNAMAGLGYYQTINRNHAFQPN